jgi:LysR family transcriptional regulator for metE and metH
MRKTKPMRLSAAGQRLLLLAEKIMPDVAALEEDLLSLKSGRSGRLHIAIECHACFEWLFPVLEEFRQKWPDIDVDIKPGLSFDALPALAREEVDLVVSSDPEDLTGITFNPLFDYNPIFVAAATHPLAARDFINAEDFRNQTLITYPVERTRLDVFSQLLIPAKVEPHAVRQIELTAIILLLVASNRGVSVLPDWVVRDVKFKSDYITRPLTENGITRSLYAAIRDGDGQRAFMREFVALTQKITGAMQV